VTQPLLIATLAVFGVAAVIGGIFLVREATSITDHARKQLMELFQSTSPELFAEPSSPAGARIAGYCAIGLGIVLAAGAVLVAVVGS